MKKIIRLTESDLTRIIKRVIRENEDEYKDRSMYDPYYGDDDEMENPLSDFSEQELNKIVNTFGRYLSSGFYEDWEAANWLVNGPGNNDFETVKALVDYIEDSGIDIPYQNYGWIFSEFPDNDEAREILHKKRKRMDESILRFSDGEEFDTSGPIRKEKRSDGWYVLGQGMLIPVKDKEEADEEIERLRRRKKNKED